MARKNGKASVSPDKIQEDLFGSWRAKALSSGIEFNVFSHIASGKHTTKEIAQAAGASLRGMTNLLNALTGMDYLRKTSDRYALQPISAEFLVQGKKTYLGGFAAALDLTWEQWAHLGDAVKTGHPYQSVDMTERGKDFFPKLVSAIFAGSFAASQAAARSISEKDRSRIRRILDVAAGAAPWSLGFALAIPEVRVTVVDLPEVTPTTREFAARFGAAQQYEYLEGDLRKVDFGRDTYDLAILGHIVHSEGAVHGKNLIKKCYAALRPGGLLLIADYVPNDARTGPVIPLLFGLNMLLNTQEGDTYTMKEYRAWLKTAGFRKISTMPVPGPSPLILATK